MRRGAACLTPCLLIPRDIDLMVIRWSLCIVKPMIVFDRLPETVLRCVFDDKTIVRRS